MVTATWLLNKQNASIDVGGKLLITRHCGLRWKVSRVDHLHSPVAVLVGGAQETGEVLEMWPTNAACTQLLCLVWGAAETGVGLERFNAHMFDM